MTALSILFGVLMFSIALFLILLVLVQRGRGGGLAGALGGMGGQSAFGAKAGDLFTRITIVAATLWILICIAAILVLNPQRVETPPGGEEGSGFTAIESPGDDEVEPGGKTKSPGGAIGGESGRRPAEANGPNANSDGDAAGGDAKTNG